MKHSIEKQYTTSILVVAAATAAGIAAQLAFGNCDLTLLGAPVSVMVCAIFVLAAAGMAMLRETAFVRWFTSVPFSVTLIGGVLICALVMGLVPQGGPEEIEAPRWMSRLGMTQVALSWPFVLLYSLLLLSLGALTARRLAKFRLRDYAFYLNHAGLWVLLAAAGFGTADSQTYHLKVPVGGDASLAQAQDGSLHHLPFSVHLHDFSIEYYAPRVGIFDPAVGNFLPAGRPVFTDSGKDGQPAMLTDWEVTVMENRQKVVRSTDGLPLDSDSKGAGEAVLVSARNAESGAAVDGWVFRNDLQPPAPLALPDGKWLMTARPEPKKYLSHITLSGLTQESMSRNIEVNKPLRAGSWMLYQSGYDTQAGRMSEYSVFQVVYDPWLNIAYVGLAMLAAGAASMVWMGKKRKKE